MVCQYNRRRKVGVHLVEGEDSCLDPSLSEHMAFQDELRDRSRGKEGGREEERTCTIILFLLPHNTRAFTHTPPLPLLPPPSSLHKHSHKAQFPEAVGKGVATCCCDNSPHCRCSTGIPQLQLPMVDQVPGDTHMHQ